MKLNEVKQLEDGRVMLKGGYYLEPDLPRASKEHKSWQVKRLMDETELGELGVVGSPDADSFDYTFYLKNHSTKSETGVQFRAPSYKMMLDHLFSWAEKQLPNMMKEDLFADARKARAARANAAKPVKLVRLNKDGKESRMNDAASLFNTESEAKAHHDQLVKNNPNKYIGHAMYTGDGELALRTELHDGRFGKVTRVEKRT